MPPDVNDITRDLRYRRSLRIAAFAMQLGAPALCYYGYATMYAHSITPGPADAVIPVLSTVLLPAIVLLSPWAARGKRVPLFLGSILLIAIAAPELLHALGIPLSDVFNDGVGLYRELGKPLFFDEAVLVAQGLLSSVRYAIWDYTTAAGYILDPERRVPAMLVLLGIIEALVISLSLTIGCVFAGFLGIAAALRRSRPPLRSSHTFRRAMRYGPRSISLFALSIVGWICAVLLAPQALAAPLRADGVLSLLAMSSPSMNPTGSLAVALSALPFAGSNTGASLGPLLMVFFTYELILLSLFLGLCFVSALMWNRARRMTTSEVLELRKNDCRSPIFLIRSFKDDKSAVSSHLEWRSIFLPFSRKRLEEILVDVLWHFGPVLTIGKPGDRLPPLGAAREYISDDQWKDRVRDYLTESSALVAVVGDTPNFGWECERAIEVGAQDRMVLIFPPLRPDEMRERWNMFSQFFSPARGVPLPIIPQRRLLAASFSTFASPHFVVASKYSEDAYFAAIDSAWRLITGSSPLAGPVVRR